MFEQEEKRKKHQFIRCPECNGKSRVIKSHTINGVPGYQIRRCTTCSHIFEYDYAIQADLQYKVNWNCSKKI